MSKVTLRPCPTCGGRQAEVLHCQRLGQADGSPLPDAYEVVGCAQCGMVFADTHAPQSAYDQYYAAFSKYEDASVASGSGSSELDARRLERTAAMIGERLSLDARLLDVGCATGGLLAALSRRGFRHLRGVDAAAGCVRVVCSQGFAADCLPLSRLAEQAANGPFDGILLSHVLEHLVDVSPVMRALASLCAPDGLIYLETPDAARYGDYPFVPFYFFDSEHVNHFDAVRLVALGARHGFRALASGARALEVAPGRFYPAVWVWLQRATSVLPMPADRNQHLVDSVRSYIQSCRAAPVSRVLLRLAESGAPTIVWGAGSLAQRLFAGGLLIRCNIVAIVDRDRNKQGRVFHGFQVEAPEVAIARYPAARILVLAAVHGEAIAREVAALRAEARVEVLDFPSSPGDAVLRER